MNKNIFEVVVVATMSAGKSTVINALIGKELLHSANEATTATITRIHDKDGLPHFSGKAYGYDAKCLAENHEINAETLKKWNADPSIKTIDLIGDIAAIRNDDAELVIYDTPGPNNSQNDNHEALTMEVINDGSYGMILYVLNATQLGVNDDKCLLEKIASTLSKNKSKEIIFLLNKVDTLDSEKGEKLRAVIKHTKQYLENVGFVSPTIIPTSATYALVAAKAINEKKLTRYQRAELKSALDTSNKQMILEATVSSDVKFELTKSLKQPQSKKRVQISDDFYVTRQRLNRLILRSGFGLISHLLHKRLVGSLNNFLLTKKETN
ncbi:dynamin family protein [Aggregatibacter actinomycetemcomitans]|uniref:dynamin family protein n=1 Tax=Aggregatibacter actinomycetemcomitans TaxID=714 RepID=UPI00197C9226|nr:dynamin family protein [Aggregatibacter actinomycetemcomitans]MBN6077484.1 dynamin family protein [Aggregatibacter actinomycetemcomitans]